MCDLQLAEDLCAACLNLESHPCAQWYRQEDPLLISQLSMFLNVLWLSYHLPHPICLMETHISFNLIIFMRSEQEIWVPNWELRYLDFLNTHTRTRTWFLLCAAPVNALLTLSLSCLSTSLLFGREYLMNLWHLWCKALMGKNSLYSSSLLPATEN